jgi:hypothetical protein
MEMMESKLSGQHPPQQTAPTTPSGTSTEATLTNPHKRQNT